ncbi:MAG: sigma-70 family RNA polymerase sigma factor [Ruminococcus sp.]
MKKEYTSNAEKRFYENCQVIELKYEYPGYTGFENWAIISNLSENELMEEYQEIVTQYTPFLLLSFEQGQAINIFKNNEDKHRKRMCRTTDIFGYDDELFSQFHNEMPNYCDNPETLREQEWEKQIREKQIITLREGIDSLTEIQKRRIIAVFFNGKTTREIAKDEGVYHSAVVRSISQSLKKLNFFLKNRVSKTPPLSK